MSTSGRNLGFTTVIHFIMPLSLFMSPPQEPRTRGHLPFPYSESHAALYGPDPSFSNSWQPPPLTGLCHWTWGEGVPLASSLFTTCTPCIFESQVVGWTIHISSCCRHLPAWGTEDYSSWLTVTISNLASTLILAISTSTQMICPKSWPLSSFHLT